MEKKYCRKEIYQLAKIFGFPGKEVWDLIRTGIPVIVGEEFMFVKETDRWGGNVRNYDELGYGYAMIDILDIKTGTGEEFTYTFYAKHIDYHDKFNMGMMNIMKMHKFKTGKDFSMIELSKAFSKNT
tara:strand:- start:2171 stop:2551 length:381 start_codon:yes stop_codon:yes gene_type:complete